MLPVSEPAMEVLLTMQLAVRHHIHIAGQDQTAILQLHNLQVACLQAHTILR